MSLALTAGQFTANAAIKERLRSFDDRRFRGQDLSRRALFEQLERPALQPLLQAR